MSKTMSWRYSGFFKDSVIVTGTHYSMSSLVGQIIGQAPEFNVVYEPLNHSPTLGYNSLEPAHWYEYYDDNRYSELKGSLCRYMAGQGVVGQTIRRTARVRSGKDILRVGKYALTNARFRFRPRRAVFKDPFLVFSARQLQQRDGLFIVLCVRHPCAFAESMKRRGKGFEFKHLLQSGLLSEIPDHDADDIARFSESSQPIILQAALLWKVVYGWAKKHYLDHPRSVCIRQEDIAFKPLIEVDRIFAKIGATYSSKVENFIRSSLTASCPADYTPGAGSYIQRNAKETTEKWKSRMTDSEVDAVMNVVGDSAEVFGY